MVAVFVVATFVLLILADGALQWSKARKQRALQPMGPAHAGWRLALASEAVEAPEGFFLDAGHTWLSLDGSGRSKIGLDAFAHRVIGRIDKIDLPAPGKVVARGEKLFEVAQGNRKVSFHAPVDAVVAAVNETVGRDPEVVKADPYHRGWICVLNPTNLARDVKRLKVAEETKMWLRSEVERFKEFFAMRSAQHLALGHVMQDGGEVTGGVLEMLDDESWLKFSEQFLSAPAVSESSSIQGPAA